MKTVIVCEKWKESLAEKFHYAEILRKENESSCCDIILQSADNVNVKAHKIILITGSNYFKDLFSSGMRESSSDCIKYKQIKGDVLDKVISFIYTGHVDFKTIEKLEEIAVCANYFQLNELIEECSVFLKDCINDENCLRYWRLARELFENEFKNSCISYILNSSNEIYKNELFSNELDEHELIILLKDIRVSWLEEEKFEKIMEWSKNNTNTTDEFVNVFLKLVDHIDFSSINGNFILSKILENDNLGHKDIRKKINECRTRDKTEDKKENDQEEQPQDFNSSSTESESETDSILESERELLVMIGDEVKTIKDNGLIYTLQSRENTLWNIEHTTYHNTLFICGGRSELNQKSNGSAICNLYDPTNGIWSDFASLKIPRYWHACTVYENKIFVCGGREKSVGLRDVEIFDTLKWIPGPSMQTEKSSFGLISTNRSLYAVGGFGGGNIEMLDSRTSNGWIEIYNDFTREELTQCISRNHDIYCFRCLEMPIIFDTRMNRMRKWKNINNFVSPKNIFKVCKFNDRINFVQYNNEDQNYIDFYQYDFTGNVICSKPKIVHLKEYAPLGALAAFKI